MRNDEPKAKLVIEVDLNDYSPDLRAAISDCLRDAVHAAIYDAIKGDVRRAFMESSLRETMLPKIVDETLKRMAREGDAA